VERIVGIGLVRPRTERPVSGVWASSRSRPVPPARRFLAPAAAFYFPPPAALRAVVRAKALRFFLPCGDRPPAVFRLAVLARRAPALRAPARAPEPARLFDGVFFCPLLERFREEPAAFRFAVFLAIVF
jgi:hypothetical protein